MIDFLLEIGFEEFPPSSLKRSAEDLTAKLEDLIKRERIFYRSIRTIYTARRIGAIVLGLSRKQKPKVIEIQGPPKKIAFDEKNKPTEMLSGFMKTHKLTLSQIVVRKVKKGEYACGRKEMAGGNTADILNKYVPGIIRSLEFPKTMRWNESGVRFPRPIRWIVSLLDRRPLRFEYAGVKADRYSMPNQHFSFKPIRLEKPREYMNFLRHGGVVVDPNERRKIILKRIKNAASKLDGKPLYDSEMIEEINCTAEYPEAVVGEFDPKYLDLPEELLRMVLKNQGNLVWVKPTPRFICVFSAKKRSVQNVQKGYSRVVSAKLTDAHFFYKNDVEKGLERMFEQTRKMTWLQDIGSLYEKSQRLVKFVDHCFNLPDISLNSLKRAAMLCKADLLSDMVREKDFTALQGIMGGHYARLQGEDEKTSTAIKEHYLPRFIGDAVPSTREGTLLSLADKVDNVVGAFISGNRPSGSYDPLAVRRTGYGAVQLFDMQNVDLNLYQTVDELLGLYDREFDKKVIHEFFKERVTRFLQDMSYRYDEINAVLSVWQGNVTDARLRCGALKGYRDKPEFVKLVIGQKRVRNILKDISKVGAVREELFKEATERKLYKKGKETESRLAEEFKEKNYHEILTLLLGMRSIIDQFFDDVMVMCDDEALKQNRLALVNYINQLFLRFADFSEIVIEGEKGSE
jgi:glycyl-tRNA synthetase beta chain